MSSENVWHSGDDSNAVREVWNLAALPGAPERMVPAVGLEPTSAEF